MGFYLDTNVIAGWFKKNIVNIRNDKPVLDTKTMLLLRKNYNRLFVSTLSFIEIANFLKSSFAAKTSEISLLWGLLTDMYGIKMLVPKTEWENVVKIVKEYPMKKGTILDLLHLEASKKNKLTFLTFDKELEKFKNLYNISFL